MNSDDAQSALYPLGLVGALGFLLPSVDKTWEKTPEDLELKKRLRVGESIYLILALAIGLLSAKATRSYWALILCVGWASTVIFVQEVSLHHRPE
jgi:hypothetical protein